ncbi:MAG: hypothetical protein K6E85_13805 [Lachnospiraceae bacterium]|nr:hypothetical protein [Lachnospiraceae bacterium]
MVFCVNCGYPLDGIKICPRCGTPAVEIKNELNNQTNPMFQQSVGYDSNKTAAQDSQDMFMGANGTHNAGEYENGGESVAVGEQKSGLYMKNNASYMHAIQSNQLNQGGEYSSIPQPYQNNQSGVYSSNPQQQFAGQYGQIVSPTGQGAGGYVYQQNGNIPPAGYTQGNVRGQQNQPLGHTPIPYTPQKSGIHFSLDMINQYGQFIGIGLLIIGFLATSGAPSFISFIVAVLDIIGAIICLKRKYKLYGFNIAAIVIASICLLINAVEVGSDILWEITDAKDDISDYIKDDSKGEKNKDYAFGDDWGYNENQDEDEDGYAGEDVKDVNDSGYGEENESTGIIDSSMVDPDLKDFLDGYERFMDKYIEFMENYDNSSDVTSMMTQYNEILEEYYNYLEAVDKYDPDTMSPADAAYYFEVINRVEKKLMNSLY